MIMQKRPFKIDAYSNTDAKIEIELERLCDCDRDGSIGGCPFCNGSGYRPTVDGEILLQFIFVNLRNILPNIETLAKFLDVFDVNYRYR